MSAKLEDNFRPVTHEEWLRFIEHVDCPETMKDRELVRRRHPRYSLKDVYAKLVFTLQINLGKVNKVWPASVLDLSAEGAMLKTQEEIPASTSVALQIGVGETILVLVGEIMHSTFTVGGYKNGVKLRFLPAAP